MTANMSAHAIPSQKILLVDDEPDILHLYEKILGEYGYQVDTALDGEAAWLELQVEHYDLVITDNYMPKLSGTDLVQVLRDANLSTPVIMSTDRPPEDKFVLEPRFQPFFLLQKPHHVEHLLKAVNNALPAPKPLAVSEIHATKAVRSDNLLDDLAIISQATP
jgi:two-component system, OmpR family, alkaline phosphatase synthesis response regulator PhoP